MTGLIFKRFSDSWFQELTALYFVCQKSRRVCALLCFCLQTLSQHAKIVAFEMASKVLEGRRNIFGHFRQRSENLRKCSKVAGTFREIAVIIREKSYAFESEKIGRYK